MERDKQVAFTLGVMEALSGGFSFETFMESLGYFYFHWEHAWTNEDYQEWIRLSDDTCTTINYQGGDGKDVMISHTLPKNFNEAMEIFYKGFWSFYDTSKDKGISEEEAHEIAIKYSQLLLKKQNDKNILI